MARLRGAGSFFSIKVRVGFGRYHIMTRILRLVSLSLICSVPAQAFDEAAETAKNGLISAIKAEDQSRLKPGTTGSGRSGIAYIRSLDQAFQQGSRQQIEYSLGQIAETYRSPEVANAIDGFQTTLLKDAEQRESAEMAALDALSKEVKSVLKSATKAADLDALLEKFNKLGENTSERRSERLSAAYQAIRPAKSFVSNWQDYLQALEKGNRNKANQLLQNLASSSGSTPVPRSMLIALIDETSESSDPPDVAPQEIKELDEIAPSLRKMRALSMSHRSGSAFPRAMEAESLARSLTQIDRAYQNFNAGLPMTLDFLAPTGETTAVADNATAARLKAKLLLLVLPRLAGAPEKTAAKPGEDALALVERMIREAGERGDLPGCVRAIEIGQTLKRGTTITDVASNPLASARAGQSYEAAGQYALAVFSYQNALGAGCDLTLAALIGKRLEALKRDHPDDYKQATESHSIPRK